MAKPSTTKRRVVQKEDVIPESIFDALNAHNPSEGVEDKSIKAAANEPTVADLMRQLEDLRQTNDRLEQTNLALSTAPKQVPVLNMPAEPKLSLDNLPDPLDDQGKYAMEVAKRTAEYNQNLQKYYEEKRKIEAAQNAPAGDPNALWEDFQSDYGSYAEDMEGVEFATRQVTKKLERRGIDVNKYMYQNSDRFFKDIAKAYDARFGKPDAEDDEPEVKAKPRAKAEEDADDGRTSGIFGGIDGSSGGKRQASPPPGDLVKDLQDIQRKTGYF